MSEVNANLFEIVTKPLKIRIEIDLRNYFHVDLFILEHILSIVQTLIRIFE